MRKFRNCLKYNRNKTLPICRMICIFIRFHLGNVYIIDFDRFFVFHIMLQNYDNVISCLIKRITTRFLARQKNS